MIEYKVKEIAIDSQDSLIVKTGGEVEFTLAKIDADIAYLKKAKKELVAQLAIEEATKKNIEGTHPQVADMSKQDLTAAYLYRQAMGVITVGTEKLAEVEKQLADYAAEKVEISKQTGITINNMEETTPEVVVETPAVEVEAAPVEETPAPEVTE